MNDCQISKYEGCILTMFSEINVHNPFRTVYYQFERRIPRISHRSILKINSLIFLGIRVS